MAGRCPARVPLLIEHLDLEGAGLDADDAFQPAQELLHDQRFLRGLQLRDVEVHAGARTPERIEVIGDPEHCDGDQTRRGLAVHQHVVVAHMKAGRPHKADRPLRRRLIDLVGALASFLGHLIGTVRPLAREDLLGVLQRGKRPHRLRRGRAVGLEVRRRGVLKIRHIHRRRAVQGVKGHVERIPRPGQFQSGIGQGKSVLGNWHFVVEPPAPLALAA